MSGRVHIDFERFKLFEVFVCSESHLYHHRLLVHRTQFFRPEMVLLSHGLLC